MVAGPLIMALDTQVALAAKVPVAGTVAAFGVFTTG